MSVECKYQSAVAEFTKAINLDPNNGDYYLERAYANIYIDKTLAEKDLRKAESLWAAEPKPQTSSSGFKSAAQLQYDLQIRRRKDGQQAFENYFRILRLSNQNALPSTCKSNSSNANQNSNIVDNVDKMGFPKIPASVFAGKTADEWAKLGQKQLKENDNLTAIESFTNCIKLNSKSVECLSGRVRSFAKINDYSSAIDDLTKIIEIKPTKESFYLRGLMSALKVSNNSILASSWTMLNSYGKSAIEDYSSAINLDPKYLIAFQRRADAYCGLSKLGEANRNKYFSLAKADEQKIIQLGGKVEQPCK